MSSFKLPSKKEINFVFASFSQKERSVFIGLLLVLLLSTLFILESINKFFIVQRPLQGGSISIGIVGVPRFVNPILASGETDQDLVALIYSGLMRKNSDGELINDLAEKYETSKEGLTYTFTLKDGLTFQDGTPLTADDVIFTVDKVKDSVLKSPYKVNWDGVSVSKIDDKTIVFNLKQPYASFLENTTLGIIPKHIWSDTPLELNNANTSPIGSGPYMIDSTNKQTTGIIDSYALTSFDKFALGEPYIKNINLYFYQNENDMVKALTEKEVEDINSITPQNAEMLKEKGYQIKSSVLPRVFGLFLNQNQNQLFINKTVVRSINQAIDKNRIVKEVLLGYGTTIDSPIPPNMKEYSKLTTMQNTSRQEMLEKVKGELAKDGWTSDTDGFLEKTSTVNKKKVVTKLAFSISTGNIPELIRTAELIKQDLEQVGIKVEIKTFETGNLNQNVIRPRKYEALLFGEIINNESDLFAFWHSSQRIDPGLNIAMYANVKVDKLLEDAFTSLDKETQVQKYTQITEMIKNDMPAIFLYSPDFIYVVSKNINEFPMTQITTPSNRYLNAYLWYTQTENVWKIFTR
jgi:peptide/nickel transport system substrate-binding protein